MGQGVSWRFGCSRVLGYKDGAPSQSYPCMLYSLDPLRFFDLGRGAEDALTLLSGIVLLGLFASDNSHATNQRAAIMVSHVLKELAVSASSCITMASGEVLP